MTKKPKSIAAIEAPKPTAVDISRTPSVGEYLENIRTEALSAHGALQMQSRDAQHDVERTIADLENWRSEIDATIAFLKAMRR